MPNRHLTVVIPTFRRPAGLERAVSSVLKQEGVDCSKLDVLVVDNDPDASARPVVDTFQGSNIPVRYCHEPNPGVANARNAAIENVQSDLIIFLDDDQSAPPHWVAAFLDLFDAHEPIISFGPVETVLPDSVSKHIAYLKAFFARKGPKSSGVYDTYYGCGNSMFDLSRLRSNEPMFDTRFNETGGEDDRLFDRISRKGHDFGWAHEAWVNEHVPAHRATLKYTLRRTFAYGQAPCTLAAQQSPPDIPSILFWMTVGAAQTLVYGLAYCLAWLTRRADRAIWLDRMVQGIGKVFWFRAFEQRFYGNHSV
tara:strand:- start:35970 stop:36896 length:927 start_codon:yes stop_codon:yes gene_type:complete